MLFRDTDARICNFKRYRGFALCKRDRDLAADLVVVDGILADVFDKFIHVSRIGCDDSVSVYGISHIFFGGFGRKLR